MNRTRRTLVLAATVLATTVPAASAAPQVVSRFTFTSANDLVDGPEAGTSVRGDATVSSGIIDFFGDSVVQTDNRAELNPGTADFSFASRLRLTRGSGDWNIMQKGYWNDHQWKMSLDRTNNGLRILCRVAGDRGSVQAASPAGSIVERTWVTVRCRREGDTVVVLINGTPAGRGSGAIGSVASSRPYLVGGKELSKQSRDQFLGEIDESTLSVG